MQCFQIDTADQVARAYRRRPPKYPVLPETVGFALVLLVNRNVSPEHALRHRRAAGSTDFTDALCLPAEAFAGTLSAGTASGRAWRGGAIASLRTLTVVSGGPDSLWVSPESTLAAVRERTAGSPSLAEAFTALVDEFRRNGLGLAAYSAYQESPAETKCLRSALTGEPAGYSSPWDPLWDARFKRGGAIAGAAPEQKTR